MYVNCHSIEKGGREVVIKQTLRNITIYIILYVAKPCTRESYKYLGIEILTVGNG